MTYRELLAKAGAELDAAGVTEFETDAWQLFSEIFSMSRAMYFLHRDEQIPGTGEVGLNGDEAEHGSGCGNGRELIRRFEKLIALRCERIPLQQITGHQEFMGLDFIVDEHVLIPRQDTEILVETVLEDLGKIRPGQYNAGGQCDVLGQGPLRVLDMCTGSGCIGISLERLAPVPVSVLGADISEEALKVAEKNGRRLGCEQYRICHSDLFEKIEGRFDVIVSNPPYIPTAVIDTLDVEVKDHEPYLALDGEEDGLAFYRRIAGEAPDYLTENGRIYLEIGHDQGAAVSQLLRNAGFRNVRIIRDLAGLDRVAVAQLGGDRS